VVTGSRRLLRRIGVRRRVALAFGVSALLLALAVGVIVWTLSRTYLLNSRQTGAVRQAQAAAAAVQRIVSPPDRSLPRQVDDLARLSESGVLVVRGEEVLASAGLRPDQVPPRLRQLVESGTTARQRVRIDGEVRLLVGIPLTDRAAYYQSLSVRELDLTLRRLGMVLLVAGVIGVAVSGLLALVLTRGALRPINRLTAAAQAVARGELSTRLPEDDRDLAELARVFNTTVADLERRVRADARFASDVSHELRTPLTTMSTALAVLQRRQAHLPEAAGEAVDLLASQHSRFQRLVLDLLDISVLTEGRRPTATERVRLDEFVLALSAAEQWGPVDVLDRHLVVAADPRHLERIVSNLVRNAESHGGGLVRVTVRRDGCSARLEVDDAGPGVPPADRTQVFERFSRGSGANRKPGGVGLGLAMVAELVTVHGGRTWVEDRPGGGARFVVELPLADIRAEPQ
jgi:signal transduction histidine kinase